MAGQHRGTTAVGAASSRLIGKGASDTLAAAHPDLILRTRGRSILIVAAASALGPEQVVVTATMPHEGTLGGVTARRLVLDLYCGPGRLSRVGAHGNLVNVAPERAKVHVPRRAGLHQVRGDGVVRATRRRRYPGASVVRPRPCFQCR